MYRIEAICLREHESFSKPRGVSDLVDLYRMAVENIEIMDDAFASQSLESTMVGAVQP